LRRAAAWGACALGFAAIELVPLPGTGDLTSYLNTHALALDSAGRQDEAIAYWEESSRANGAFSPVANLFLAGKRYAQGDRGAAFALARDIPDSSFAAAPAHALLGDLAAHEGRSREAIAQYERSLAINSGQRRIRRELVRLLAQRDPGRAREAARQLAEIDTFFAGR
jgi:tetratricopeptide (TPR) repeat protein